MKNTSAKKARPIIDNGYPGYLTNMASDKMENNNAILA